MSTAAGSYIAEEENVQCALEEALATSDGSPNLSAIARKWKVCRKKLSRRYAGKDCKSTRAPTNRKLNEEQERALLAYIAVLDEMGLGARLPLIESSANHRVGVASAGRQWIVTMCPSRKAHIATDTSRETVTVIEAASAGGDTISPMVIIGASQHSESWVNNDLSSDTLIAVSESGYSDDVLAWKWIKHFADKTNRMRRGSKQLLIFDGHGSHCTKQFIDVCTKNDIIPFTLTPHASRFLQPLDVAVFQPYKHWHRDAVDKATRIGCTNFSKVEFLAALNSIRAPTMKPRTIKTGFRCAGIFPFNPAVALQQFDQPANVISESPSSSGRSLSRPI